MRKFLLVLLIVSLTLVATGCWDQVEIDERGFVIGVAIDLPKSKELKEKAKREAPDKPHGKHRFVVTQQFVIPGALTQNTANKTDQAFLNITSEGGTMFEVTRELATRTSRSPFFQHLKVLVISEDVARKKYAFGDTLDFFIRDQEMRRSTKVLISKGNARSTIEINPKNEKLPVMYIDSIVRNSKKSARMLKETRVGDVHEYLLSGESFVIPRIIADTKEVKVAGGAVFNGSDHRMVGFLGEEETEGLNFIRGNITGGLLKVGVYDNLVIFEIQESKQKIKANVKDINQMEIVISIDAEGNLVESFERIDFLREDVSSKLEKKIAEEIERLANDAIRKSQKEFKIDFLGLGKYVYQHHYKLWKTIKNDWDQGRNYFTKCKIRVEAKVKLRQTGGIINKSERLRSG
ncbi:Ger(x)C family spore germination protein [Brevibacillus sp. SYSU BS000544]|uniref:Ger(x)C family spore germination protein n=1 Tax=Brevibacillus sp. SYSU BS000544 TaxID=3416443 RepID=UPI003CE5AD83